MPNLLDQNVAPAALNQSWADDLTYIWTEEGWLYLAVVVDLFNREVVGWSIKPRMTVDIVATALTMFDNIKVSYNRNRCHFTLGYKSTT